ncbi:hypothetical protein ACFPH6_48325 [Streptomyces xiangluensis]|uniref:Uncharacterized protein n=1 Tax=Streptomyces xiangluensis TaxID=2665720 RepID=A0ABV8ZA13_9ACTN
MAGFVRAALLATVPVGAPAGGAPAAWLGNVRVLVGSAAVALLSAATLRVPARAEEAGDVGRRAAELSRPPSSSTGASERTAG